MHWFYNVSFCLCSVFIYKKDRIYEHKGIVKWILHNKIFNEYFESKPFRRDNWNFKLLGRKAYKILVDMFCIWRSILWPLSYIDLMITSFIVANCNAQCIAFAYRWSKVYAMINLQFHLFASATALSVLHPLQKSASFLLDIGHEAFYILTYISADVIAMSLIIIIVINDMQKSTWNGCKTYFKTNKPQ